MSELQEMSVIARREAVIKILEDDAARATREADAWAAIAQSLAIELECFMMSCEDTCAKAKYWSSAQDVIERYHAEVARLLPEFAKQKHLGIAES